MFLILSLEIASGGFSDIKAGSIKHCDIFSICFPACWDAERGHRMLFTGCWSLRTMPHCLCFASILSHNTKTTSWIDPRCLDKPQKPLEECEDDGMDMCLSFCLVCLCKYQFHGVLFRLCIHNACLWVFFWCWSYAFNVENLTF